MAKRKPRLSGSRVYSYIRFSTKEQKLGDSERRQLDDARAWAKREGAELDETLTDEGLSGYHGHHRTKGNLGRFLAAVEVGTIPPGSTLLVENLDRLGREGPKKMLQEIIFKLWDRDLALQTLSPEETYEPGCDNDPKFLALLLYLQRAWEESKRKSDIGFANWKRKREKARNGIIATGKCPAWLEVVEDEPTKARSFEVILEAAQTIRTIFNWKLQGIGTRGIVKKLNQEAHWERPNGWHPGYVMNILTNRAVIGEFQPQKKTKERYMPDGPPVSGYFPQIVNPEVFHAVQERIQANRGKGGRTGQALNLFTHLVKCAYCGGPMAFVDKGKPPKGATYLVCNNGRRGLACAYHSVRYAECEKAILDNCPKLRPDQVLPNPDEQAAVCQELRQRVQGREAELRDIDRRLGNLDDQIADEDNKTVRQRLRNKMVDLEQRRVTVQTEKQQAERELAKAEAGLRDFNRWKTGLRELREALREDDPELRLRLRAHLRELIDRIEVFAVGFKKRYDPDEEWKVLQELPKKERRKAKVEYRQTVDHFAEQVEAHCEDHYPDSTARKGLYWEDGQLRMTEEGKTFHAFLDYVTMRRMSKAGRFLRVHFKTGQTVGVVPQGSLASGLELVTKDRRCMDGWRFVSPDIDRLWREFKSRNGH